MRGRNSAEPTQDGADSLSITTARGVFGRTARRHFRGLPVSRPGFEIDPVLGKPAGNPAGNPVGLSWVRKRNPVGFNWVLLRPCRKPSTRGEEPEVTQIVATAIQTSFAKEARSVPATRDRVRPQVKSTIGTSVAFEVAGVTSGLPKTFAGRLPRAKQNEAVLTHSSHAPAGYNSRHFLGVNGWHHRHRFGCRMPPDASWPGQ